MHAVFIQYGKGAFRKHFGKYAFYAHHDVQQGGGFAYDSVGGISAAHVFSPALSGLKGGRMPLRRLVKTLSPFCKMHVRFSSSSRLQSVAKIPLFRS